MSPRRAFFDQNRLDPRRPTINEQFDPSDIAAVFRNEEHGGFGDLFRAAGSAHRHGREETRFELLNFFFIPPPSAQTGCFNRTRAEGIHADLAFFRIDRRGARK
jgi:hypothetical protein